MIHVKVILHSILREKLPPEARGQIQLELPDKSTTADVMRQLDLPEYVLVSINGVINRDRTTQVKEGDELRFFRPGAGG
jgi:sulfur carrier protein ThiS